MNDSVITSWFMVSMILFAVAQTALLFLAYVFIRVWGSKLNRKLHRIESNTRHAASALAPEEDEVLCEKT